MQYIAHSFEVIENRRHPPRIRHRPWTTNLFIYHLCHRLVRLSTVDSTQPHIAIYCRQHPSTHCYPLQITLIYALLSTVDSNVAAESTHRYLLQIAMRRWVLQQIAMCGYVLSTVDSNMWMNAIYSRQQCVDVCYLQQIAICG